MFQGIHGEFFDQGDKEKGLGFVPDTLFDRNTAKTLQSDHWFYKNMGVRTAAASMNATP